MDITQKRQISEEQRIFVDAVRWDEKTPIELLGTGSQQVQLYPSDIDLFSSVKTVKQNDPTAMFRNMKAIFENAEEAGDMFFIEFKLQNLDGTKQKWFDTDFDEAEFVAAATSVDFLKIDYVIFIRGPNLFTELSSIYSFSPMPSVRNLVGKIGEDFGHYYKEGKVYKSLKRMYSIYKLQGKKEKLVQLSKLFNSSTGFKYSLSSNLKAIELLLDHFNDYSIQNLVKANLKNLENIIGVKIRSSKQMKHVIGLLDAQIEKETQEFLKSGNTTLLDNKRIKGTGSADLEGDGRPYTYDEWENKYEALLAQKKQAIDARERKKAAKDKDPYVKNTLYGKNASQTDLNRQIDRIQKSIDYMIDLKERAPARYFKAEYPNPKEFTAARKREIDILKERIKVLNTLKRKDPYK
jgi:hypothetical protein|nr:MAG: hypothetical protein [Lake Baikal virophage 2]